MVKQANTGRKRWDCRFDADFAHICAQAVILAAIQNALKSEV